MSSRMYASISLGNAILTGVMSGWLLYFYLPPGGPALVPLGLFGLVILASRLIHIPLSLWIDDLARRMNSSGRTWLVCAAGAGLCMALFFSLLWTRRPGNDPAGNLLYVGAALIAFNLAAVIQQTAYEALGAGPALEGKEPGVVSNWRMIFLLVGSVLAGIAGPAIERIGYAQAMAAFAVVSAIFLVGPALFGGRRPPTSAPAVQLPSLSERMKHAWSKPAFRVFAATWGLMWLATTFTFETLPYIVTEICGGGKSDTIYLYFTSLVVGLGAYPAVMALAGRCGARRVFRGSLLAGALVAPGLLLIGDRIPLPLLAQGILWIGLQAACLAGARALPGVLTAAIGAGDQETFGNLIDQAASGVALAVIPLFLMLGRSQMGPEGALGVRLLGAAGGAVLLAAFIVLGWFKTENL